MKVRIGFNHQVTAPSEFHSLYDWCFQTMWLCSGALEDPVDDTVLEWNTASGFYSVVRCLMHAIQTETEELQQDAINRTIQIASVQ